MLALNGPVLAHLPRARRGVAYSCQRDSGNRYDNMFGQLHIE